MNAQEAKKKSAKIAQEKQDANHLLIINNIKSKITDAVKKGFNECYYLHQDFTHINTTHIIEYFTELGYKIDQHSYYNFSKQVVGFWRPQYQKKDDCGIRFNISW